MNSLNETKENVMTVILIWCALVVPVLLFNAGASIASDHQD